MRRTLSYETSADSEKMWWLLNDEEEELEEEGLESSDNGTKFVMFFASNPIGWPPHVKVLSLVKMPMDIGADTRVISSSIWEKLGRPTLGGTARTLKSCVGHKLFFIGTAFSDLIWNGREESFATNKPNSKPLKTFVLCYSNSSDVKSFYRRMIQIFAANMLPLNDLRSQDLSRADGEKLKTASARKTRKGIAVMGYYYKLEYVSGEQIPYVAPLGRLRFNEKTPEEEKIGIFQKDIFFADN